jgi:hypothetical protein
VRGLRQHGDELAHDLWREWGRGERMRKHDNRDMAPGRTERESHAYPVKNRHFAIGYHEVEILLRESLQRRGTIARSHNSVASEIQDTGVKGADRCMIVDDQQARARRSVGGRENRRIIKWRGVLVHRLPVSLSALTVHARPGAG